MPFSRISKRISPLNRILGQLKSVTSVGDGYSALCPAHKDTSPSLTIGTGKKGQVLLHCHAGCETKEIVEAIGLSIADLYHVSTNGKLSLKVLAKAKGFKTTELKSFGVEEQNGYVRIPYRMPDGSDAPRHRIRTAPSAKDGSKWNVGNGEIVPYGLDRLSAARKTKRLILVEGESDCWSLWKYGYSAIGIPGATLAKTLRAEHLKGVPTVFVHREPDQGGDHFVSNVADQLRRIGYDGEVFEFSLPDVKDPNALHLNSPRRFKSVFNSALASASAIRLDEWPELATEKEEPVDSFPLEVFPPPAQRFAQAVATAMACPIDLVAVPMVIVAASAIGNTAKVAVKEGWAERAILYGGCTGHPGTAKSPAQKQAVHPLRAAQEKINARIREKKKDEKPKPSKKCKSGVLRFLRDDGPERLLVSDITMEALAPILQANLRGILSTQDELVAWARAMNEYKGRGSDRQKWLSLWSGEPIIVDRKISDSVVVDHPFVCVLGTLTPDMLGELGEEKGRADGSLERMLISFPDARPGEKWTEVGIPEKATKGWEGIVFHLLSRSTDEMYTLSSGAKRLWIDWYNTNSEQTDNPALLPSLRGFYSKMRSHCARFALVLFLLRVACGKATGRSINEDSMRGAIKLAEYFKSHARKVHRAIAGRFGALSKEAQALVDWVRRNDRSAFDERTLWGDMRSRFGNHNRMRDVIKELSGLHIIREQSNTASKGRGRKASPAYEVHPDLFASKPSKPTK